MIPKGEREKRKRIKSKRETENDSYVTNNEGAIATKLDRDRNKLGRRERGDVFSNIYTEI